MQRVATAMARAYSDVELEVHRHRLPVVAGALPEALRGVRWRIPAGLLQFP